MRRARTDAANLPTEIAGLASRPEADNLVGIYAALADMTKPDVLRQFGNGQFSTFKAALADLAIAKLGPIAEEMRRLNADPGYMDVVLRDGAARARALATPTIDQVKDIVGFLR